MKIAIIGATSFLGTTLISELKESKHDLHLFSRVNSFDQMPNLSWTCYNYPSNSLDYAELMPFDVIYYCAGAGIQPKHQDNNTQIYELNVFEPIRLATALKDNSYTGKLITFGSYFEIGNHQEERSYTEKELATHTNPLPNAYCTAKNLLTRFVDTELRPSDSLSFVFQHFILTNIYGATENNNRLIPYIIQTSIKKEPLSFTAGTQERQYTHIRDITNFLANNLSVNQSGVFNLTTNPVVSVRDMIEKVLHVVEEELAIKPQVTFGTADKRDVSMKYLALNTSHLQNCFNFAPQISLEQGIKEYISLYNQPV
jgi:nucleoside-diphosphate-sugar epimerase